MSCVFGRLHAFNPIEDDLQHGVRKLQICLKRIRQLGACPFPVRIWVFRKSEYSDIMDVPPTISDQPQHYLMWSLFNDDFQYLFARGFGSIGIWLEDNQKSIEFVLRRVPPSNAPCIRGTAEYGFEFRNARNAYRHHLDVWGHSMGLYVFMRQLILSNFKCVPPKRKQLGGEFIMHTSVW